MIKTADWVVDLGFNGGDRGGAKARPRAWPEDRGRPAGVIAKEKRSYIGRFLRELARRPAGKHGGG